MKFLSLFVLLAVLVVLAPIAAMADSYDGCINYAVSVNNGIYVGTKVSEECAACGGAGTYSYPIIVTDDCDDPHGYATNFCTTASDIESGWYYVNSIGSGCDSTPQGCVRITPCP